MEHPEIMLLQHVDDLLLASKTTQECVKATRDLLDTLQGLDYRVSSKKAQLCTKKVNYLGYKLSEGLRWLSEKRVQAVLQIPPPTTKRQI